MKLLTIIAATTLCLLSLYAHQSDAIQCMCNAWGDPHYVSFDRMTTHFQGRCKYIIVMPQSNKVKRTDACYFKLEGQNKWWHWNNPRSRVACIWLADLYIFGHQFRMGQGGALWVDGRRIHSRAIRERGLISIRPSGRSLIVSIPKCNIRITWDGRYTLRTYLIGHRWRNKVKGLCGNCNGNPRDDRMTRDGAVVRNVNEFGNSYLVGSDRRMDRRCPAVTKGLDHPCRRRYRRYVDRMNYCGALKFPKRGPFAKCLANLKVNRATRYFSCRMDACTGARRGRNHRRNKRIMRKAACRALRNLEQRCEELDLPFERDWEETTNCQVRCPAGMKFRKHVRPCAATCQQRSTRRCRFQKKTDACRCPRGMLQNGRSCVRPNGCPGAERKRGGESNAMHKMMLQILARMKNGRGLPNNLLGVMGHKFGPQFKWNQNKKGNGGVKIPNFKFNFNFGGGGRAKKPHFGVLFTVQNTPFCRLDNGELIMIIQVGRSYLFPQARLTNFGTRVVNGIVRVIPGMHSSVIGKGAIRMAGRRRMINLNGMTVIISPKFRPTQLMTMNPRTVVGKGRIMTLPGNKRVVVRIDHARQRRPQNIIQIVTPIQRVRQVTVPQTIQVVHQKVVIKNGGRSRIDHGGELIIDRRGKEFVPLENDQFIEIIEEVHMKKK